MMKMHKFMFLAAKQIDKKLDSELGIGFSQCMILMYVSAHTGVSQKNISKNRDITPAAVSRHIEALVKKKYLQLRSNKTNKREHILAVTSEGLYILENMVKIMNKELDVLCVAITAEETRLIDDVFTKLLSAIDASGENHAR